MKKLLFLLLATALFCGCKERSFLAPGPYLGVLRIDSTDRSLDVPFNMSVSVSPDGHYLMEVTNAGENILINEVNVSGDTLAFRFPVFLSEIICRMAGDSLFGTYYPKGRQAGIAYGFSAKAGVTDRFPAFTQAPTGDVTGRWRIIENPGTPDSSVMVGEFVQEHGEVTGTILAVGGDYRYLQGKVSGSKFMVSAVDGAHNLIFTADLSPLGTLENGKFLGSAKWKSTWRAVRDSAAALPPMTEVVWIKKDTPPLAFSFPGMDGQPVSLADTQFRDKVVIVEATGSWCPNCMDEALFLEGLYERYRNQGLRIIGLCFEDQTLEQSLPKMQRFASQTGAGYVFAYAGPRGGTALKDVLYVADGRLAYPTTLYIDRTGKIRRIETGFSGPGTGSHYTELTSDITGFVEKLLKEP